MQHDGGFFAIKEFIDKHKHDGWSLSVYDTATNKNVEIDCPIEEIPKIISYIYNWEHAYPILFIGENIITDSYAVGMPSLLKWLWLILKKKSHMRKVDFTFIL